MPYALSVVQPLQNIPFDSVNKILFSCWSEQNHCLELELINDNRSILWSAFHSTVVCSVVRAYGLRAALRPSQRDVS